MCSLTQTAKMKPPYLIYALYTSPNIDKIATSISGMTAPFTRFHWLMHILQIVKDVTLILIGYV